VIRSVVGLTLLLVGGVVLLLGAGVVAWIAAEDLEEAREEARRQHEAAEAELRALAHDLVADAGAISRQLVEGADRRLRLWIAEEPLSLYRDPVPPHDLDVEALRRGLSAEVRARSLAEGEHVEIVSQAMEARAAERIERVAAELREAARRQAELATDHRRDRLVWQLALLLLGMALLLAGTLYVLVLAPIRRLRGAVDRIAAGDLSTPIGATGWPTAEMSALADDVEHMRNQIRGATEHLEAEVARKTRSLAETLEQRTQALEELRATRDRLVQVEKMAGLGTLAGGVAHEFNNLLGGVLACVENARAATQDPSVVEDLEMAKRTAGRATRLVDALLGVARPGQRDFEAVDLRAVVDDVVNAAAPGARRREVEIRREGEATPTVEGDAGQLHQVVLNLVTNALQAVDDGEEVVVALREEAGQAVLEVRDQGPGIPEEERDRVFEPFFTGRRDGTGLGLFVSYGIVERHGGRIEVGEAAEGGARVAVRIPLAGADP
jgi:signal transduction histidine kinase